MIRTSTVIATVAILLSLSVHFFGLTFAVEVGPTKLDEGETQNVIDVGETFEDLAEAVVEPVPPEPAPEPEPPAEVPPEPESADIPTSQALVASENPQNVFAPDTGEVSVQPDEITETTDPTGGGPAPEAVEASGDAVTEPVEPIPAESVAEPSIADAPTPDAPQQLAALPAPVAPETPVPSPAPAIPPEQEAIVPEAAEGISDPVLTEPEDAEIETATTGSDLAIQSSLRPKLRPQETREAPNGPLDFSAGLKNLDRSPSELIESPLTVYKRDGINLFAGQSDGTQNGAGGTVMSRGPGNSDVTNYVGLVLVHLNRVPVVPLSAQGSARVFFEINPDGSVARVDILDSTGSDEIERAARSQVLRAVPFPRPPEGKIRRMSFIYRNN